MARNSRIEWTDHTFNPWWGCTKAVTQDGKLDEACRNCYAEGQGRRFGVLWGSRQPRRPQSDAYWKAPYTWAREAEAAGRRARVFCASMADVCDPAAPEGAVADLWRLVKDTPWLYWLLLTKRPERYRAILPEDWGIAGYDNVMLMTTVGTPDALYRLDALLSTPAAAYGVSCEPLLGALDLTPWLYRVEYVRPGLSWVVAGGESGPKARPCHPDWARDLRDQCDEAFVPFLWKQWGEWAPWLPRTGNPENHPIQHVRRDGKPYQAGDFSSPLYSMIRAGKHAAGRLIDGREHLDVPAFI